MEAATVIPAVEARAHSPDRSVDLIQPQPEPYLVDNSNPAEGSTAGDIEKNPGPRKGFRSMNFESLDDPTEQKERVVVLDNS